jgi:hypothetical protein
VSSIYEFHAFVVVKGTDRAQALRIAEKATEEVETSNPDRVRVSLDDGSPAELESEEF